MEGLFPVKRHCILDNFIGASRNGSAPDFDSGSIGSIPLAPAILPL